MQRISLAFILFISTTVHAASSSEHPVVDGSVIPSPFTANSEYVFDSLHIDSYDELTRRHPAAATSSMGQLLEHVVDRGIAVVAQTYPLQCTNAQEQANTIIRETAAHMLWDPARQVIKEKTSVAERNNAWQRFDESFEVGNRALLERQIPGSVIRQNLREVIALNKNLVLDDAQKLCFITSLLRTAFKLHVMDVDDPQAFQVRFEHFGLRPASEEPTTKAPAGDAQLAAAGWWSWTKSWVGL